MTPLLTALVAFGAGIASFLSPCVLPLVPAYIGHLAGTSVSERQDTEATMRTVAHAAFFVLGFSTIFVLLWTLIGLVGWAIQGYTFYLRYIGGVILVIFGLHVAGVFRVRWLNQERRVYVDRSRPRSYPYVVACRPHICRGVDALHWPNPCRHHCPGDNQRHRRPGLAAAGALLSRPWHPLLANRNRTLARGPHTALDESPRSHR